MKKIFSLVPVAGLLVTLTMPARADNVTELQARSLHPNLEHQVVQPLRYRPDGPDFVIENGAEFFNRSLYGGHDAFRVDGGDLPEFSLYLPGRGGNLRLGLRNAAGTKWLHTASNITMRYRPGELHYEIADALLGPKGRIHLVALAYAATQGLGVQVSGEHLPRGTELVFAFGPGNGQRGQRDGDIGTERVPISQYFQFLPEFARDTHFDLVDHGFVATAKHATISATVGSPAQLRLVDAAKWNDPAALFSAHAGDGPTVVVGSLSIGLQPVYLSLQVTASARAPKQQVYSEVGGERNDEQGPVLLPRFAPTELAQRFADAREHFAQVRNRVRIETPDPWLNAAVGALNVAADAVWDDEQKAIMHGAIAWRTKLLGWRGPYVLDDLGWHDRARANFDTWIVHQNTSPIPAQLPPADPKANLARNETGLHSNGDMSNSHYDMNLVFIDALLRHLLWTGDVEYARAVWPVLERHLAWERRLFRREFGQDHLPLYDAYADIWASDDLYYNGGGVAYSSAYNAWHNEMATRIAHLIGKDPAPYEREADAIRRAMRQQLWMPERGAFAEYRDALGRQLLHPSYGLWSFYHTIDSHVPTAFEAASMAADLDRHLRRIPVVGQNVPADKPYWVLSETEWMPYSWSINNVVFDENMHTALAYWQAGRSETAFELAKGTLLASLYMGISPGNIGTMNYLDVYRREAQRDFADGAGVMSRAVVEGLFGMQPDALAGVLTVRPGFPAQWNHASLTHPDLSLAYRRSGDRDSWTVGQSASHFRRLVLELPARRAAVAGVWADGQAVAWKADRDAVGAPVLLVDLPFAHQQNVEVAWSGGAIDQKVAAAAPAEQREGFRLVHQGDFAWWQPDTGSATSVKPAACTLLGADWTSGPQVSSTLVDLSPWFNDRVSDIFKPGKYQTPRSPFVTLALPSQGIGAWAGHLKELPVVDDTGLRALHGTLSLPNGLAFATPGGNTPNVIFTSQWDNYPREATVPLKGQARRVFLLMAGSTNFMQSRIDNGEVVVAYADGTGSRIALRNPDSWWPIEQDYFVDDYQFPLCGRLPVRVDLKTARVRVLDPATFKGNSGRSIDGGAATVLDLPLDPSRQLKSITVRALANDVVIGLMGVTLDTAR